MDNFLVGSYKGDIFEPIGSIYRRKSDAIRAADSFADYHQETFVVLGFKEVHEASSTTNHRIGLVSGVLSE